MRAIYSVTSAALLGWYALAGVFGWELGGYGRETAQQSTARHASGGHRSVWITSYRGGK